MAGESASAIALWNNIGHLPKIENFAKNTKCLLCNSPAKQAEHLINKAHGGNHTKYNVIPVCAKHKKPGGIGSSKKSWQELYGKLTPQIEQHVGTDDSKRLNPYHKENEVIVEDLRNHVKAAVESWRIENGMI